MNSTHSALLGRCISELELRTSAEVVFELVPRSGDYADLDSHVGATLAFSMVCFIIYSHLEIHPTSVPLPILLAYATGFALCRFSGLRSLLTRRTRREAQVSAAARASFVAKGIHRTRGRTGILLYFSIEENRAAIVADTGAEKTFDLEALRQDFEIACRGSVTGRAERIGAFLRTFGVLLEKSLPVEARPEDRIDELPNTPHT